MIDGLRDHYEPIPWRAPWLPLLPIGAALGAIVGTVIVVVTQWH